MIRLTVILLLTSTIALAQRADFSAISFKKADSIAISYERESLANLPVLAHNLTTHLTTDVEKFRAIYMWVSTNIENDYSSYLKTKKKRKKFSDNEVGFSKWNDSYTPKVFENLLKNKKTACTGYAYLIRELALLASIKCKIIDGYGRTPTLLLSKKSIPNHSWNAVQLNNKWYLCDATWSAGTIVIDDNGTHFKKEYFDGYFLTNPALFIKNHYPLKKEWSLLTNTPTFKDFIDGPVIYKAAFLLGITTGTPQEMHIQAVKNEAISFRLRASKIKEDKNITLIINNGINRKKVTPLVTQNQNKIIVTYTFQKTGQFDTHIQINGEYIASYVIRVKRS